ncbi:MAG: transposase [Bacteroidetes bacterium]|nr:transposase [Bacteroidota bacterium]
MKEFITKPNTFTSIYIHTVFSVKNRESLISNLWKNNLYAYITSIITNNGDNVIAIGGMPDHVHIFMSIHNTTKPLSDLMRAVKGDSSRWINENKISVRRFGWQSGYGAFSCGPKDIDAIANYIRNQEEHHSNKKFIDEYKQLLIREGIEFDEKHIFQPID